MYLHWPSPESPTIVFGGILMQEWLDGLSWSQALFPMVWPCCYPIRLCKPFQVLKQGLQLHIWLYNAQDNNTDNPMRMTAAQDDNLMKTDPTKCAKRTQTVTCLNIALLIGPQCIAPHLMYGSLAVTPLATHSTILIQRDGYQLSRGDPLFHSLQPLAQHQHH